MNRILNVPNVTSKVGSSCKVDVNETSVHPISQLCIHVSVGVKQCRAGHPHHVEHRT